MKTAQAVTVSLQELIDGIYLNLTAQINKLEYN